MGATSLDTVFVDHLYIHSPDGDTNWRQVASPGGGSSSYTNTGLSPSTTYFYRIRARNSAGVSAWSGNASGATMPAPAIALSASGRKVQGFHVIDLNWSGAGGSVNVFRDGAIIANNISACTYTDNTGNKGGHTYVFRVCLVGTSTCSNDAVVVF